MLPEPSPELAVEHGLFSVRQALAAGHTRAEISRNVRRGRWVQVDRGVLRAVDHEDGPHDQLLLALLVTGPAAVLCGRSVAAVRGWELVTDPPVPEIAVADLPKRRRGSPPRPRLVRRMLSSDDVELLGLLRLTTAARTAVDLAGELELVDAVVAVDSALRRESVRPDELTAELRSRPRMRGRSAARRVLDLASPLSGSVPESEIRVRIALDGLQAPVAQYEVIVGGLLIARVDFAWPWLKLVLEIDGFTYHADEAAFQHDRDRQRDLEEAGWRVLRFTAKDVRDRPHLVLDSLRRAGVREISTRNSPRAGANTDESGV